jgi:hypothetical protein
MSSTFGFNTLGELGFLSEYLKHTNQALTEVIKERESEFQKSIDRLSSDGVSNINNIYGDPEYMTDLELKADSCAQGVSQAHDIASLFYSSFIVLWFSIIEQRLFALCKDLDLKMEIKIDSCENLGKGIDRAKKFLLKTKDYQIDPSHWGELIKIRALRNNLVHNGLMLPLNDELLNSEVALAPDPDIDKVFLDYLHKHNLLSEDSVYLLPQLDYCEYLVEFGENLLEKLGKDLDAWNV